ncbi:MAG: nuclear transport factor 2 family protein [Parvularculaceae bacterium]|nr:nuclear transport factor 2 family protein [Parvularculaceae bacterium]
MLKFSFVAPISILALAGTSALAQESGRAESCRRGEDVRVIEVLMPGIVGKACDVRVVRDGGARVTTPYNANADKNFCRARAAELASQWTLEGFECSTAVSSAVEASLAGGTPAQKPLTEAPAADPIEKKLTELSLDQQAEQIGAAPVAPSTPAAPVSDTQAPLVMAPVDIPGPAPAPERAPRQPVIAATLPSLEGIIEPEPVLETPVVLTAGAQPTLERAPRPAKTNGAGRLVGAPPSLEDLIDSSTGAAATPAILAATGALPPRSAESVVKGVLSANAAAWNEGNLSAYLAGYDESVDVRLVVGPEVATGFNSVRKYYETMVANVGAMGRMSFSDLDVKMTSREIATVVGRYAHDSGASRSAGAMTIVMKQIDGRWRIVQDTRVKDAAVPTLAPVN